MAGAAMLVAAGLLSASPTAAVDVGIDPRQHDTVTVNGRAKLHYEYRKQSAVAPEARLSEYVLARLCNVNSQFLEPEIDGECAPSDGTVTPPGCGDDEPVRPLWNRTRTTTALPWSRWEMVVGWVCPADLLPTVTEEEFRSLQIEPLPAFRQPSSDETLVNKPLIVYTRPSSQTLRTGMFDFGIDVVATPRDYTWDFGVNADVGDHWQFALRGTNVTDELGLTESNSRIFGVAAGPGGVLLARPLEGSEINFQAKYRW